LFGFRYFLFCGTATNNQRTGRAVQDAATSMLPAGEKMAEDVQGQPLSLFR